MRERSPAEMEHYFDREEIRQTLLRYAASIDRGDFETMSSCFTSTVTSSYHGNELGVGAEAIVRFIRSSLEVFRASNTLISSTHILASIYIEIVGDEANAVSHGLTSGVVEVDGVRKVSLGQITYRDTLKRVDQCWLIDRRELSAAWRHSFAE